MNAITDLASAVGARGACMHLAMPHSTYYHRRKCLAHPPAVRVQPRRPIPPNALSITERTHILDTLNSERFVDSSPSQVRAELLDEGHYIASERTIYRVLDANHEVRERRDLVRHPNYDKPELMATAPLQVISWDITKLKTTVRGVHYHLYDLMDIYSRYHPGWMIALHESDELAAELIEQTCARQGIAKGTLTIHADRGPSMKSKLVADLMDKLEIVKSHSRPHVSNDNPYSESAFKTLKYRPEFPERFASIEEARAICAKLFHWVNNVHRHSGIAMLTPAAVHFGRAESVIANRNKVLRNAFQQHPERFVGGIPTAKRLPDAVYINKPVEPMVDDTIQKQEINELNKSHLIVI